ncbi:hypothetical protein BH10ACI3_BH10ACI3_19560 [soil metagenome]
MWNARTKDDLIIEVWEKLDCENVGAVEIEAIETVIAEQFGTAAIDSPMVVARLLADEGAELRHSEIMALFVERASDRPYDAALRNVLLIDDLPRAARSLRSLESLRRKYKSENDAEGLRLLRETAIRGKRSAAELSERQSLDETTRQMNAEIAHWFTIWLQTPELFDNWLVLRRGTADFMDRFGKASETQIEQ